MCLAIAHASSGVSDQNQHLDALSLAAILIENDNLKRAREVLAKIKDPHDVQTDRYYLLLGLLAIKEQRYPVAIEHLLSAHKSGLAAEDQDDFALMLARAYLLNGNYQKTEETLGRYAPLLERNPVFYQLYARLYLLSDDMEKKKRGMVLSTTRIEALSLICTA